MRPLGGCVRAFLVEGPVLHVGQYTASPGQQPAGDLSCSYRVAQMQISHFMRTDTQAYWPGAREAFLDVPEVRHLERAVPAVRRLQRTVEQAWKDGFDPVGAESIENETFNSEGLLMVKKEEKARKAAAKEAKAAEKEAKAAGKIVSTASGGIALNGTSIGHSILRMARNHLAATGAAVITAMATARARRSTAYSITAACLSISRTSRFWALQICGR